MAHTVLSRGQGREACTIRSTLPDRGTHVCAESGGRSMDAWQTLRRSPILSAKNLNSPRFPVSQRPVPRYPRAPSTQRLTGMSEPNTSADGLTGPRIDSDPVETGEWLDAFDSVVSTDGPNRARYLMARLHERAAKSHIAVPGLISTPYVNTIPPEDEAPFPETPSWKSESGGSSVGTPP